SSHDAYDNMNFEKIVGVNPGFPDKQYKFALWELFDRYIKPKFVKQDHSNDLGINKQKTGDGFNPGFEKIWQHAKQKNIPMLIYLHPEKTEVKQNKYNAQGDTIIKFAEANKISLVKELNCGITEADYRDDIHPNDAGQTKMFNCLYTEIKKMITAGQLQVKRN
ncbi:MAG TPA: hypothetical protein VNY73_03065, partial [Bacteroidia bacterium]|nr:hypothetical protein [Bacteroidia bacterium]